MIRIVAAESPEQFDRVRSLFLEYAAGLNFSLCFQGFDAELAALPGRYAPPTGRLYLAMDLGEPVGCIALRQIGPGICEMKRLYLRPSHRGQGLGRLLAEQLIADASAIGYDAMRLDTSASMHAANGLYKSLGFTPIERYNNDHLEDTVFMELRLRP
jgi:putative acetyltransferase